MLYLDLTNLEDSDIKYKVSKFPDGQQSITLEKFTFTQRLSSILIKSRLNSFTDLELIICANQSLKEFGIDDVNLYVPYFLGARSDRKFVEGSVNYLKNVICPIINSQKFNKVIVLDPHSDVLEACLDNYVKINNFDLVEFALSHINDSQPTLVSPDAGAYKKIFDVAKHFGVTKIVTATKVRDIVSGNIISTEIDIDTEPGQRSYIIVDDICDGGRTFIELAKAIRSKRDKSIFNDKIYLVVTHGIFSAGFGELNKYFDGIFTTNSVKCIGDVDADTAGTLHKTNVKQLNVFLKK